MVCIGYDGNNTTTCILSVLFFKRYGIEFSLKNATIRIPSLSASGEIQFAQGYFGTSSGGTKRVQMNKEGIDLGNMEVIATKVEQFESNEEKLIYIEDIITVEENLALMDIIKELKAVFVEISGLSRARNFEVELH
ncbi:hypothetical protein MUCCIDRAFT_115406 [Mucor lusitanicus CBS 277.49]|uniref:Uncharacterized protein n=1 Tax=Mucor lusitanicus CBS 277.49 TaxID=747725 RepID=A0A162Q345_MUCCL|nr:hypothetical protein MUCCIDRAFT_115406 [Mucor lusitanicus CBS 277.49]